MNLLVISSYPQRNYIHGEGTVGVASYSKNTLLNMRKKNPSLEVTVLAEVISEVEEYVDSPGITVRRVWKRGKTLSILRLIKEIKSSDSDRILAEFEMYMMGKFWHATIYVICLMISKLFGKKIYIVLHQVVNEINTFEKNKLKVWILTHLSRIFYKFVLKASTKVVVFEQELADRLNKPHKCVVIPHAVEDFGKGMDEMEAKEKLGLDINQKYILYFGFISPYKGIDDLIKIWPSDFDDARLIIAGGANPNHAKDPQYNKFVKTIYKAAKNKNILTTGFIPEDKIKYYFSACRMLVLPYKTFMSSSGPLSIALSLKIPILLSDKLSVYFKTKDFRDVISEVGLKEEMITYTDSEEVFKNKVKTILDNPNDYIGFSASLAKKRDWKTVSGSYIDLILNE